MRVRVLTAAAVVLTLAAGCRDTQWPSDADRAAFCDVVTGLRFTEGGYDDSLEHLGTPPDLPFEARRYLLDLAEDDETDPAGERALDEYLGTNC